MKKTLFFSLLATALMGAQVFAEPTGTAVEGYDKSVSSGKYYYGVYSETDSVSNGKVTVKVDEQGDVPPDAEVYGGYAKAAEASNNTLTMQGGNVANIYGGFGKEGASNNKVTMQGGNVSYNIRGGYAQTEGDSNKNTVIMTGGSVQTLYGGNAGNNSSASGNVVIVSGGTVNILSAGYANGGALNNKLHLVGRGASNVSIADAQGESAIYNGGNVGITLTNVFGGYASKGPSTGNSIDIYGTGIGISGMLSRMQVLTFNIADSQMSGQSPEAALILTSKTSSAALNLEGVDLQIKDLDVKEWTTGKSITLVQSVQAIQGLEDGKAVDITNATGAKVAQGKLQLVDDLEGKHLLTLTIQGNVPEPTTGSLSLLALAGLCARRRKK